MSWMLDTPPDLTGRTYAVTGGTAGIGYFAAEHLTSAGADVVLLSRSASKMAAASLAIREHAGSEKTHHIPLDLTSLASVNAAAAQLRALPRLDGIFLNGGPMQFSTRELTRDGLPLMLGAHTVANVALALGVLPALEQTRSDTPRRLVHASTGFVARYVRNVTPASRVPRTGVAAYTQAKALTEVFAFELQRRLQAAGMHVASVLSHPGVGVDAKTPQRAGIRDHTVQYRRNPFTPWAHGKDAAAWIGVRALTDADAAGGDYFAPARGTRGEPVRLDGTPMTATVPAELATEIWDQLTGWAGLDGASLPASPTPSIA